MINLVTEIKFKTARSSGAGGQNVNKVETMVEGYLHVADSVILSLEQKEIILKKLASKINSEGFLQVRSQVHRTQLSNKEEVVKKMHALIAAALKKEKPRKATKPSKQSRERRIESKKRNADIKDGRKKIRYT